MKITGKVFLHATLILLCAISLFPIYWMINTSFKSAGEIFSLSLIPMDFTFDNYLTAAGTMPLGRMILNSFIFTIPQVILQLVFAVLFSYAFSRWTFKGKKMIYSILTLSWLIPLQAIMVPNYVAITEMSMNGTVMGMIVPNMVSVFACLQLFDAFELIPRSLYGAAELDGSNSFQTLIHIAIPTVKSSIFSLAIILMITAWNSYLWPSLVSTSLDNSLIQVGLKSYVSGESYQYGALMAASTMACLPIFIVYIVFLRQIQNVNMQSGIK